MQIITLDSVFCIEDLFLHNTNVSWQELQSSYCAFMLQIVFAKTRFL